MWSGGGEKGGNEVGDKPAVVVRDDNGGGGRERMPAETEQLDRFAMPLSLPLLCWKGG